MTIPTTVATGASPSRSVSLMNELNKPNITTTGSAQHPRLMTYRNLLGKHKPSEAA
jgi:hypothetical protein